MSQRYRVAALQFEPTLGVKEQNLSRLLRLSLEAARAGARLIVTPEMATTGYCWYSRAEIAPYVEPIPGPTTDQFAAFAREHNCYLVLGLPEVDPQTGIYYNSAALIGPHGILGVYRKTHSFLSEPKWAKDGDHGLPVWEIELGRLGVLICMDAVYFEPARILALQGAEVLCFPTNWLGEKSPSADWMTRAYENGCFFIAANRYGRERGIQFSGGSAVLNPDGTIQNRLDTGEGIVFGEVDRELVQAERTRRSLFTARRPELYDTLTLNTYLWNPLVFHRLYEHQPLPKGRRTRIAVAQYTPLSGNVEANLAQIASLLERRPTRTRLVIFPEYSLTGAPLDAASAERLALTDPARVIRALERLARETRTWLVVGFLERLTTTAMPQPNRAGATEGFASTAVLIGPSGLLAQYRKTHVIGHERSFLRAGRTPPPILDLPLGRIGLLVGSDLCFPEISRVLASAGCDLIAVPAGPLLPPVQGLGATQIPLPPPALQEADPTHFHLARVRAQENSTVIAYAALSPPEGTGWTGIFGPIAESRQEEQLLDPTVTGLTSGVLDTTNLPTPFPTNPLRAKELLRMRQTHLYDLLQLPG